MHKQAIAKIQRKEKQFRTQKANKRKQHWISLEKKMKQYFKILKKNDFQSKILHLGILSF